jgi:hypothetical protein
MEQASFLTRVGLPGLASLVLAGCGSIQLPALMQGSGPAQSDSGSPSTQGKADATGQGSEFQPKVITKVAPIASIMLEKNCPSIVQPYRISDNLESAFTYGASQWLKGLANTGGALFSGRATAAQPTQGLASAKLAAKQLNWLPMEVETMYGERSHRQETKLLERDSKLGQRYYPIADRMLQQVLAQVRQAHNYHFKLFIVKTSSHNALSRPGGYLYLDQGMLEKPAAYPKAYFAIAHEVAHVLQRHETMELQSRVIDSFAIEEDMKKTIVSAGANPEPVLARAKIGKNQFIRHHIDQELQADSCAARILSTVFADPRELAGSLNAFLNELPEPPPAAAPTVPATAAEKLAATVHDLVDKPINVHPTSIEREQNLRAMYKEVAGSHMSSR